MSINRSTSQLLIWIPNRALVVSLAAISGRPRILTATA